MSTSGGERPEDFLKIIVHRLPPPTPGLTAACAGFEGGTWRAPQFADHLFEWLPEFALNYSEYQAIRGGNVVALMRRAAQVIYSTDKYQRRGEFGELLLHVLVRQAFGSYPAISKLYYKDSSNDTVKGFDAVHVVASGDSLELWLGESKFYTEINKAIADVVAELQQHCATDYLRTEFTLITNKIDPQWPHAARLKTLLSPNTSLDQVFNACTFAVLLTYDSGAVGGYDAASTAYVQAFTQEIEKHHADFSLKAAGLPGHVRLHLFLVPLGSKESLIRCLHQRLEAWKQL